MTASRPASLRSASIQVRAASIFDFLPACSHSSVTGHDLTLRKRCDVEQDSNDCWAVMRAVFLHLLTCAVLAWQVAGDTIRVDAGADSSTYTLAGAAPRELGASIRLTQYDLPASTVYYLPAGSPRVKKTVNQTRPFANGYFSSFHRVVIAQLCIQAELFYNRGGAMHPICDAH